MLLLKKLSSSTIFHEDFKNLNDNNRLLKDKSFSIIYGPNGTGKSSLCKLLQSGKKKEISIEENGNLLMEESLKKRFFVIEDHKGRNIIKGDTDDFILSSNIRREKELNELISVIQKQLTDQIINKLDSYKIDTLDNCFVNNFTDQRLKEIIKSFANRRDKGKSLDWATLPVTIDSLQSGEQANEIDMDKIKFYFNDCKTTGGVIETIKNITTESKLENDILKIEEFKDAVLILQKYNQHSECIVCDTSGIKPEILKDRKTHQKEIAFSRISPESKEIVSKLIDNVIFTQSGDPFSIKNGLFNFLRSNNYEAITILLDVIRDFENSVIIDVSLFLKSLDFKELITHISELNELVKEQIEMDEEDISIINNFLESSLGKKVTAKRSDSDKSKILITLGDDLILEKEILLSHGEQNFLSLCFEFLKAKKFPEKIVVIDDPISSFDSINKNRIAYCIATILKNRAKIIFTHNLDLIRLMEHQIKGSFDFFIFNNSTNALNGFIEVNEKELSFLLDTYKFIGFLQKIDKADIKNEELFLISITSFLRSYCSIALKPDDYKLLTKVLHFKEDTPSIDLKEKYNSILNTNIDFNPTPVTSKKLIESSISNEDILDKVKYPLINRTLKHIYNYILLRLKVENYIFSKYSNEETTKLRTKHFTITKLIDASAIPASERRFLISRKTLLNEFNHFEYNLNIFQSALDIKDKDLDSEKEAILRLVEE